MYSFSQIEETQTITVRGLDTNTTIYALMSLTYAYSSEVTPEAFNDTLR